MELRQVNFKGYQGKILGVIETPLKPPLLEIDTNEILSAEQFSVSSREDLPLEKIRKYFEVAYKMWGKFGPYSDIISVKVLKTPGNYIYYLSFIGRLAFHKPGLAVDLLITVRTQRGNYFVGIKRKFDPGQGKLALPGGFIDVDGYHLKTPVQSVIQEAEEEIGLKITVLNPVNLFDYSPHHIIPVKVDYLGQAMSGELIPLGIVPTGDNEKMPSVGLKRVYNTSVFALVLDMAKIDLNENGLANWLKAGDDASGLVVRSYNNQTNLQFGLEHHQKIFDAWLGSSWKVNKIY